MIYLDNAATTKPKKEVVETIINVMNNEWGNPSSTHTLGKSAREVVENARKTVAEFIGAKPNEIIFTSGACESNSLAISGYYKKNKGLVFVSEVEHKSVLECAKNYPGEKIPVDMMGRVEPRLLSAILGEYKGRNLVSIQFANSEIGTINNIKDLSKAVHDKGCVFHTDATQIMCDRKIDVNEYGIDMMSFSGQKFGCPKGIGVLYVRKGIEIEPIIYGTQERGLRGGTENVPYIAGLSKSLKCLEYYSKSPVCYFIEKLRDLGLNDSFIIGDTNNRLSNNLALAIKGVEANSIVNLLDMSHVYVSTGSACNSKSIEPSYVLKAIGLDKELLYSVVRLTFSNDITTEQLDEAAKCLKIAADTLRSIKERT